MTTFFKGPPLIVHVLIAAMVNAIFFPLVVEWTGGILYGFLTSVAFLAIYGVLFLLLATPWPKRRHGASPIDDDSPKID